MRSMLCCLNCRASAGEGGFVLRHHHHARGSLVEPMHDARAQLAADAAEVDTVMEQRVDERAPGMPRRRMHDEAGGLVDHDQVRVLVEHDQRDGLGGEAHRHGLGREGLQHVAGAHALRGPARRRVQQHVAGLDPAPRLGSRDARRGGQGDVRARSGSGRRNGVDGPARRRRRLRRGFASCAGHGFLRLAAGDRGCALACAAAVSRSASCSWPRPPPGRGPRTAQRPSRSRARRPRPAADPAHRLR